MQNLPLKAPGLFRKIMVGEYDFYSPLTIGFALVNRIHKRQYELFHAHYPDIVNPTDEQVQEYLNGAGSEEMTALVISEMLSPGEHGISSRDIVDHVDTDTVVDMMDFFTQSASGKVKTYNDFKASSRSTEDLPVPTESTTTNTSPDTTGKGSTNTSRPKGSRGKSGI